MNPDQLSPPRRGFSGFNRLKDISETVNHVLRRSGGVDRF